MCNNCRPVVSQGRAANKTGRERERERQKQMLGVQIQRLVLLFSRRSSTLGHLSILMCRCLFTICTIQLRSDSSSGWRDAHLVRFRLCSASARFEFQLELKSWHVGAKDQPEVFLIIWCTSMGSWTSVPLGHGCPRQNTCSFPPGFRGPDRSF